MLALAISLASNSGSKFAVLDRGCNTIHIACFSCTSVGALTEQGLLLVPYALTDFFNWTADMTISDTTYGQADR